MSKASNSDKHIQVFEHQPLRIGESSGFTLARLEALQKFHAKTGDLYFSLIHKGVKFKEYVGVLLVGDLQIEVLPKADKDDQDAAKWQKILIGMLRSVPMFELSAPTEATLSLKRNALLDLYFELFVFEVERLIRQGLIKKYRKEDGNIKALKGKLIFNQNIQNNLVHKERFYTRHTIYDNQTLIHQVLFKTILLLHRLNACAALQSRISSLLLHFPEQADLNVNDGLFGKIKLGRKTRDYEKALSISRLLLLQYHPDVSRGRDSVLALMFDMNALWEKFVYTALKQKLGSEYSVKMQPRKDFWIPKQGYKVRLEPDILIQTGEQNYVLDTKWKRPDGKPGYDDLRQMYAYCKYFNAKTSALLYPGGRHEPVFNKGNFVGSDLSCGLGFIPVQDYITDWKEEIAEFVGKEIIAD